MATPDALRSKRDSEPGSTVPHITAIRAATRMYTSPDTRCRAIATPAIW